MLLIGLLSDDRMYVYLQSIQAYVSPPIAAVFLFGLFSSRVNGKGAIAALFTGLVLGVFRLIIEVNNKIEPLANESLKYLASINFLHYAIFLFIISSFVLVVISLSTEKPSDNINSLLFNKKLIFEKNKWLPVNIIFSVLLVLLLLLLWYIFR
jgi:SSS family solute:Na+ symporter